jgi:hypothetical protein
MIAAAYEPWQLTPNEFAIQSRRDHIVNRSSYERRQIGGSVRPKKGKGAVMLLLRCKRLSPPL